MAFATYTGARRSEMLRALASDVDLAGGRCCERRSVSRAGGPRVQLP
jgi:hypothetical protein